ncbi:MAG: DJ-1/PfpI family protein [Clostridia bacterium]|nr:DJ-1/PfpI family protein [Clostridia bacterium]
MVYLFLANGFEEVEALTPVDILRRAGVEVTTVGIGGQSVTGSHGITVTADAAETDVTPDDLTAVILPGGMPGTRNLDASATVRRFLDAAAESQAVIGAICAAPSVLGHRGLLAGKRATCFPGFESELAGATVLPDVVVTDGNVVTAKGAGAALPFALALASALASPDKAAAVEASLQVR